MKIAKQLLVCILSACFIIASPVYAFGDTTKSREVAKANLNNGKIQKGLTALIKLSDAGDDEASYILGVIFSKSKIPQVQRSVTLAEQYLLRGAKNCHEGSLRAISAYVYKKRGSKLFDPAKAKRLESACKQKSQIASVAPKPTSKTHQAPTQRSASRSTKPTPSQSPSAGSPVISASVRNAWASQRPSFQLSGVGASGVAISADGVFLTNHHVVDGCRYVAVKYQDMIGVARVLFADKDLDLAAIKVAAPTPYYAIFDSSTLRLGETLVALGYPVEALFGNDPSVSEGRLTNTDQGNTWIKDRGYLLVSIPLASGNSGGPVYNNRGLLRGLVSWGISNENLKKLIEKEGSSASIHSVTFNFIVSGLSVMDRLNQKNVKYSRRANSQERLDVEEIAARGKMSLANVECG